MWGVKHTVHEMEGMPMPEVLMPSDYKSHSKIKKENHNFNKMNMPSHFKFKEYCPLVFKKLRHLFSYSEHAYLNSLISNSPITVVPSDSEGEDSSNEDDEKNESQEMNNSSEDSNETGSKRKNVKNIHHKKTIKT
jgi:1-phosphatidylinositol-5-phosphate 4-kinase